MSATRILIADDHPLFRRGLREAIEETGRYRVVAEASDGTAAIEQVRLLEPDLAVIDLSMPGTDGFAVAEWIAEHAPSVGRVVMTMHKDPALVDRAFALGVAGYLLKDDAYDELARCLDAVLAGERFVSPSIGAGETPPPPLEGPDSALLQHLTRTQREVLHHLAENCTSREIGERMGLSPRTVENHRARIASALELRGPNRLLAFALRNRDRL